MYSMHQFARNRPRLAIAVAVGVLAAIAMPHLPKITRTLVAWNVGVWLYLLSVGWLMMRASHQQVRKIAGQEERSAWVVLSIMTLAAVLSIVAIVVEMVHSKDLSVDQKAFSYLLTGSTVLCSWLMVGVLFTFHYAYMYFHSPDRGYPLRFPEEPREPDYWDFLYFSFTIAVAAQTSDVTILSRRVRQVVLAQSILSFFFNVAILGFSINIAAGLVGNS